MKSTRKVNDEYRIKELENGRFWITHTEHLRNLTWQGECTYALIEQARRALVDLRDHFVFEQCAVALLYEDQLIVQNGEIG